MIGNRAIAEAKIGRGDDSQAAALLRNLQLLVRRAFWMDELVRSYMDEPDYDPRAMNAMTDGQARLWAMVRAVRGDSLPGDEELLPGGMDALVIEEGALPERFGAVSPLVLGLVGGIVVAVGVGIWYGRRSKEVPAAQVLRQSANAANAKAQSLKIRGQVYESLRAAGYPHADIMQLFRETDAASFPGVWGWGFWKTVGVLGACAGAVAGGWVIWTQVKPFLGGAKRTQGGLYG